MVLEPKYFQLLGHSINILYAIFTFITLNRPVFKVHHVFKIHLKMNLNSLSSRTSVTYQQNRILLNNNIDTSFSSEYKNKHEVELSNFFI